MSWPTLQPCIKDLSLRQLATRSCADLVPQMIARAAKEMQEEIAEGIAGEVVEIQIKVGMHYGPAILMEDGDVFGNVFGDAVNVAARMAGIAKGDQIITTEATIRKFDVDLQEMSRQFDKTNVRGKEDEIVEIVVYQIVWESSDDVTRVEVATETEVVEVRYLNLEFRGQPVRISSNDNRIFVMGRGVQKRPAMPNKPCFKKSRNH
jgi:adenylate cyclase